MARTRFLLRNRCRHGCAFALRCGRPMERMIGQALLGSYRAWLQTCRPVQPIPGLLLAYNTFQLAWRAHDAATSLPYSTMLDWNRSSADRILHRRPMLWYRLDFQPPTSIPPGVTKEALMDNSELAGIARRSELTNASPHVPLFCVALCLPLLQTRSTLRRGDSEV